VMLGPDRFTREIRIAAALNHPHILPLHDSGEAGGRLFYVMPFVRGGSLRERLAAERQLPVDEAVRLVRQVAAALHHAHGRGLVHRDIKPENILLHEGEAMVTDFGIALAADAAPTERLTETGLLVGTPEYMSPEQAAGERALDARSDVYSLGCVLYELLAGLPPHAGPSAKSLIARRFTEPAPHVRRVRPQVPVAVDEAVARALAVDPSERFPTAAAFAEALAGTGAPPAVTRRVASVAVLPFLNLSPDPENEFFADGITEDVIAQLAKVRTLKVIGRGSVMLYNGQEVGEPAAGEEGFGGDDGRTSIFDYWSMPELVKWTNGHNYDGGKLSGDQKQLRDSYGRLLALINEPAFRDGSFFPLNPANNKNPNFGQVGSEPAGGHWLYAFLRFDPISRQRFLVAVNLHPKEKLNETRVLVPEDAIRFLSLIPDAKSALRFTERLAGNLEIVVNQPSFDSPDGLALPPLEPLTAYFFEISASNE